MMEDGPFTIRNEELNLSTLNSKLSTLNFQKVEQSENLNNSIT